MKSNKIFTGLFSFLIFSVIYLNASYSQNITNTLGSNGSFKIKDGATTFFTLSQSNGAVDFAKNLKIASTTGSATGVILKNNTRFIHDYNAPGTTGFNLFIGLNSGNFTLSGTSQEASYNLGVGNSTLGVLTTGYSNVAVGSYVLNATTTGLENTAVGFGAMYDNITGSDNSALGNYAMANLLGGVHNSAFGRFSMYSTTSGYYNCAFGSNSLYTNITGSNNVAIGYYALSQSTAGSNTAVGYNSLASTTTGFRVTAVGYESLTDNIAGYDNTSLGYSSLTANTSGIQNTSVVSLAGTTITTGHNLTLLGFNAEPTSSSAINQITLGDNTVTSLRCNVQTITSLSDSRDKKNIKDLTLGLGFLMKIKPRQFNWDRREWYENNVSDGSRMQGTPTAGFIAQELDEVQTSENAGWMNLVLKDNPEKWDATYGNLLPVMVKAIQELNEENEKLKMENESLEERLAKFEELQNQLAKKIDELGKQNSKEIKLTEK